METFAQNRNYQRFLLTIIVIIAWLYPILFWLITGTNHVPRKGQIVFSQPTDSYYSIADHHCYALVHLNTLTAAYSTESPLIESTPLTLELQVPGQKSKIIASDVQPGKEEIQLLEQVGKQALVVRDDIGVRASQHIFYRADKPTTRWLTRSITIDLLGNVATITYSAEATLPFPTDLEALLAGEIERELFIKRVFYPSVSTKTELMSCVLVPVQSGDSIQFPAAATQISSFTGNELSTIDPPIISVENNVAQITLKATVSGWRYNKYAVQRLIGILPSMANTHSTIVLIHNGTISPQPPFPKSEVLASGYRLTWKNPPSRVSLDFDFAPPAVVTADVYLIPKALLERLYSSLSKIDAIHYFVSILFTLTVPLFLLVGLRRLRKQTLESVWPQLRMPLYLSGLMWVGPLGGAVIAFLSGMFFEKIPEIFSSIIDPTELVQATLIIRNLVLPYAHIALWVGLWISGIAVILLALLGILPRWYKKFYPLVVIVNLTILPAVLLVKSGQFGNHVLPLALEGGLLATVSAILVHWFNTDAKYPLVIPRVTWVAGIALLIFFSIPLVDTIYLFDPIVGWSVEDAYRLFLLWGICIIPYLQLLFGLVALKKLDITNDIENLPLIRLIFSSLVGFTGVFPQVLPGESASYIPYLFSPVPFVLAWISFRFITHPVLPEQARAYIAEKRSELLLYALKSPGEIRDLVLEVGPNTKNWQNGCIVAKYGLIVGGVLAAFYCIGLLPDIANRLSTPFLPMVALSVFILPIFLRWVLASFFLGYFFPHLPGQNGAAKGFALACAIAASVFVYDFIFRARSWEDIQVLFALDVILTVLGLMGIGVLLDYRLIRQAGYQWPQLLTLYRLPYLAGYVSSLLTALSSTVIGIVNGQVSNWTANLVEIILRNGGR
jgi:hypothetical protein